jgi:hypothetical protein
VTPDQPEVPDGQAAAEAEDESPISITLLLHPALLVPVDALAKRYEWTREKAITQMLDDWGQTFAWQDRPDELFRSEYA